MSLWLALPWSIFGLALLHFLMSRRQHYHNLRPREADQHHHGPRSELGGIFPSASEAEHNTVVITFWSLTNWEYPLDPAYMNTQYKQIIQILISTSTSSKHNNAHLVCTATGPLWQLIFIVQIIEIIFLFVKMKSLNQYRFTNQRIRFI